MYNVICAYLILSCGAFHVESGISFLVLPRPAAVVAKKEHEQKMMAITSTS